MNFLKTAIRRSKPRKQGIFLTVRANCDFEQTTFKKKRRPTEEVAYALM